METITIYVVTVGAYEDKRDVTSFRDEDRARDEVASYDRLYGKHTAEYHTLELHS
jgi:hypothetical protein